MPRIHPKHTPLLMALFMSFFMAGVMSSIVLFINQGYSDVFFSQWGHAFLRVWPIAFVLLFIFRPIAAKLVSYLTHGA